MSHLQQSLLASINTELVMFITLIWGSSYLRVCWTATGGDSEKARPLTLFTAIPPICSTQMQVGIQIRNGSQSVFFFLHQIIWESESESESESGCLSWALGIFSSLDKLLGNCGSSHSARLKMPVIEICRSRSCSCSCSCPLPNNTRRDLSRCPELYEKVLSKNISLCCIALY